MRVMFAKIPCLCGMIQWKEKISWKKLQINLSIFQLPQKYLKEQREMIISNQIGRAGTSIGANIHEAQSATIAAMEGYFGEGSVLRRSMCNRNSRKKQSTAWKTMFSCSCFFFLPCSFLHGLLLHNMKHLHCRSYIKHSAFAPYDLPFMALRATEDEKMKC